MEALLATERLQSINPDRKPVIIRCFSESRWTSTRPTTNEYFNFRFVSEMCKSKPIEDSQRQQCKCSVTSFLLKAGACFQMVL